MKKILITALITFGATYQLSAQSATFTDVNPDARSAAMGDAGYALKANAYSVFNNTSAVSFAESKIMAGYSYNYYAPDAKTFNGMHAISGFYKISEKHAVALGFRYLSYKKIDAWDSTGALQGNFSPYEWSLDAGYSYRINNEFSVGANVRYLISEIADSKYVSGYDTGSSFGVDVSAMYKKNDLTATLGVYNIGSKVDYGVIKNDMSSHIRAGVAYDWEVATDHSLTGALQGSYLFTADDDMKEFSGGVGVDYTYLKHYSLRAGYAFGDSSVSCATVGLGVLFGPVTFDFSYRFGNNKTIVKNSMLFGLSLAF